MRTVRGIRRLVRIVTVGLVAAAVATELAKPQDERTWHGRVLGFVPYDFRPPTLEKIRDAYWNPHSDRLFSDRVFGVGWAVNLYRARTLLTELFERGMGSAGSVSIRMKVGSQGSGSKPDVILSQE